MGNTLEQRNQFIAYTRDAAKAALELKALLDKMQTDWASMSTYLVDASGSDPDAVDYDGNDFTPNHEGLMKADITSAYNTFGNIITAFTSGDVTNLVNIKRY